MKAARENQITSHFLVSYTVPSLLALLKWIHKVKTKSNHISKVKIKSLQKLKRPYPRNEILRMGPTFIVAFDIYI